MAQAAAAAGIGMQIAGNLYSGETTANTAEYNALVDDRNAALSLQQSQEMERRQRVTAAIHLGNEGASYAANGVAMTGSALDVLGNNAANAERDALNVRYQGLVRSNQYLNQAAFERYRANTARTGAWLGATGAAAGGAARVLSMSDGGSDSSSYDSSSSSSGEG